MGKADLYIGEIKQPLRRPVAHKGKGSSSVHRFINDTRFEREVKELGENNRGERLRHQLSTTCNAVSKSFPGGLTQFQQLAWHGQGRIDASKVVGHSCQQVFFSPRWVLECLSTLVIPRWCQNTSRRTAHNAADAATTTTTATPVGNTSPIKNEIGVF